MILVSIAMQRDLAKALVWQANTLYIVVSFLLYVGSLAHLTYFETRETWIFLCHFPTYIAICCSSFLVAMSDALPPVIRRVLMRFCNPGACLLFLIVAVTFRLPGADESKGLRTLWSIGAETVTNMDVTAKFSTVLLMLLARASWSSWRNPGQLALYQADASLFSQGNLGTEPPTVWRADCQWSAQQNQNSSGRRNYELAISGDHEEINGNWTFIDTCITAKPDHRKPTSRSSAVTPL